MAAKSILALFASACLIKMMSAQCIGAMNGMVGAAIAAEELALAGNGLAQAAAFGAFGSPFGYGQAGYGAGYCPNVAPLNGGGFAVTSSSPIVPTGITVISENAIEGPLSITGQLPFLGAIALEGALPTAGVGAINYGCGNGAVGIVSEGRAPAAPVGYPGAYPAGPGFGAAGLGGGLGYPGLAGPRPYNGVGVGCGGFY